MAEAYSSLDTLRGSGTPLLAKMALGMISQELSSDPKARAAFTRDPTGFIRQYYGAAASPNEEQFFQAWLRFTRMAIAAVAAAGAVTAPKCSMGRRRSLPVWRKARFARRRNRNRIFCPAKRRKCRFMLKRVVP